MYGMSEAEVVTEESPLDPKTEYAKSKVKSEIAIRDLAADGFSPTFLRNGTVYGISPRMRFDTVLNNLTGAAVALGKVTVYGDGKPWRPVLHVRDVARAFHRVLEAPAADVHNEAINNGADHLNHQVKDLAEIVTEVVPDCELEILSQPEGRRENLQGRLREIRTASSPTSSGSGTPARAPRSSPRPSGTSG